MKSFFQLVAKSTVLSRNVVPSFARDECLDAAVWSLCCSLVLFGGSLSAKR